MCECLPGAQLWLARQILRTSQETAAATAPLLQTGMLRLKVTHIAHSHPANAEAAARPRAWAVTPPHSVVRTTAQIRRAWWPSMPPFVEYLPRASLPHTGSQLCQVIELGSSERLRSVAEVTQRVSGGRGAGIVALGAHSLSWSVHVGPHCPLPWRLLCPGGGRIQFIFVIKSA